MTIFTLGDSHCDFTFRYIPNISINRVGPITMKRMGYPEDLTFSTALANLNIKKEDIVIFCCGEIDIRCWVNVHLQRRKDKDLQAMLKDWVVRYLDCIVALNLNKVGILSVPPPSPKITIYISKDFPVNGTDEERALYTAEINKILQEECYKRSFIYVDIYSKYKDEKGMLREDKASSSIHILLTDLTFEVLKELKII